MYVYIINIFSLDSHMYTHTHMYTEREKKADKITYIEIRDEVKVVK